MTLASELGLHRHNTYEEIVRSFRDKPGVPYPNRVATKLEKSAVYGQLKDALRTFSQGEQAWSDSHNGGSSGPAPFVPPRPRFYGGDDDFMGPPLVGAIPSKKTRRTT